MNNAKLWLVVKPTVGIPLFLSAVAIGSFAVHVSVVSMAPWLVGYYQGNPINPNGATAALEAPVDVAPAQAAFVVPGQQEVLVLMPDGTTARAILQPQGSLAALE
jgi:light-harvesting protein B-800-850 alpha chain